MQQGSAAPNAIVWKQDDERHERRQGSSQEAQHNVHKLLNKIQKAAREEGEKKTSKSADARSFEYLAHTRTKQWASMRREKRRCGTQCYKQSKNNMRARAHAHAHTHRNCFPVAALGKLKLHYGPPEGGGERGWRKRKRERKCEKGGEQARGRVSVLLFVTSGRRREGTAAHGREPQPGFLFRRLFGNV